MSYRQLHFIRRGILSISNYIFKSNYGHAVCGVLRGVALNRGLLDYFPAFVGMTLKGTWHDGPGVWDCGDADASFSPSAPSVRHWDRL